MSIEKQNTLIHVLKKIFKDVDINNTNSNGYTQVMCPFHTDNKPSASINPLDGYFNCFAGCAGENGLQFKDFLIKYFKEIKNLDGKDIDVEKLFIDIIQHYDNNMFEKLANDSLLNHPNEMFKLRVLGINDDKLIQDLKLSYKQHWLFAIPVEIDDVVFGYKYYTNTPNEFTNNNKSGCSKGLKNGLIIPFNLFKEDTKPILICEGEKDMIVARMYGYNAITLTGGCKAIPSLFKQYFFNKEVYIAYDNDDAGRNGAIRLANFLLSTTKKVKIIDKFHQDLQPKQDLYDYFIINKKTKQEFDEIINNTSYHTYIEVKNKKENTVPLSDCELPHNYNKSLKSYVQIRAEGQTPQSICSGFKIRYDEGNEFTFKFLEAPLQFMVDFIHTQPAQVEKFVISVFEYCKLTNPNIINHNAKFASFSFLQEHITIYTSIPAPYNEGSDNETQYSNTTFTLYSTQKLLASQVYLITYKAYASYKRKHYLSLLVEKVEQTTQSFKHYSIDDTTDKMILAFSAKDIKSMVLKINEMYLRFKSRIPYLDYDLWLAYELTFHSCLSFRFNNNTCRGTIYTNVIGDTRVGKSKLGQELVNLYQQGKFINAKLTTVDALVGGTDKQGDNTYIKAGVLPRNNESLLILEELHGLGNDYFKKITEIKSSGKISINRVSGELTLPCNVRLIEISNPKMDNNLSADSVRLFTNGVQVIKNLINNPEDIARNDIYMIIAKPDHYNYGELEDNKKKTLPLFDKELYENKIRWVWSRKENQIIYEDESYFVVKGKQLQELFDCDGLGMMGAEAPEKLARLSIALASMLVSTDNNKEYIYVKKEHVDFITNWIIKVYSSDLMRINEYANNVREYSIYNPSIDLDRFKDLYREFPTALDFLANNTAPNKNTLSSYLGENPKQISVLVSKLSQYKLIKQEVDKIIPTIKFRRCWKEFNKTNINEIIEPKLTI